LNTAYSENHFSPETKKHFLKKLTGGKKFHFKVRFFDILIRRGSKSEYTVDSNPKHRSLSEKFDKIWRFSTSVFRWPKEGIPVYAGSATFVVANGQKCFLTAEHVWKELQRSDRITLNLRGKGESVTIDKKYISCLYATKRLSDNRGPDLALLQIPILDVSKIERYKVFYNLDRRKSIALVSSPLYNTGRWAIIGAPGEFCSVENKGAKLDVCLLESNLHKIHEHGGFDYVDMLLDRKDDPELPSSYGGLSGSGLWQFQDGSASLEGVVFYEFTEATKHYVRCHARKSIYFNVFEGVA
jgi:hypothetical protein